MVIATLPALKQPSIVDLDLEAVSDATVAIPRSNPYEIDIRAAEIYSQRKAALTLKTYNTYIKEFQEWCAFYGLKDLPADSSTVVRFLSDLTIDKTSIGGKKGKAYSTINIYRCAIRFYHFENGYDSPTDSVLVKNMMSGVSREQRGRVKKQMKPLTSDIIAAIRATSCVPLRRDWTGKGNQESATKAIWRGRRQILICSLFLSCGLRISNLITLQWDDIQEAPEGHGHLTIRYSKTDQSGKSRVVSVPRKVMEDVRLWKEVGYVEGNDWMFPNKPRYGINGHIGITLVRYNVHQALERAGIDPKGYNSHSGRVGLAQGMTKKGAPLQLVSRQGGWDSPSMVGYYTRNQSAEESLPYLPE